MNKEAHIIIALLFIILIYFIGGSFFTIPTSWLQYSFSFLLGAIAPDLLEKGGIGLWNHRGFIHSKGFTKALFFFIIPLLIILSIKSQIYIHLVSLSAGIICHNLIDSTTRMSWGRF
jgi:membrane-bound metal-dependent hydrolase YbcI (DUF457 family)